MGDRDAIGASSRSRRSTRASSQMPVRQTPTSTTRRRERPAPRGHAPGHERCDRDQRGAEQPRTERRPRLDRPLRAAREDGTDRERERAEPGREEARREQEVHPRPSTRKRIAARIATIEATTATAVSSARRVFGQRVAVEAPRRRRGAPCRAPAGRRARARPTSHERYLSGGAVSTSLSSAGAVLPIRGVWRAS